MTVRDDETVPSDVREALRRWEGWELAEFLDLSVEDILDVYTFEVMSKIDELEEVLAIQREEDGQDEQY